MYKINAIKVAVVKDGQVESLEAYGGIRHLAGEMLPVIGGGKFGEEVLPSDAEKLNDKLYRTLKDEPRIDIECSGREVVIVRGKLKRKGQ